MNWLRSKVKAHPVGAVVVFFVAGGFLMVPLVGVVWMVKNKLTGSTAAVPAALSAPV